MIICSKPIDCSQIMTPSPSSSPTRESLTSAPTFQTMPGGGVGGDPMKAVRRRSSSFSSSSSTSKHKLTPHSAASSKERSNKAGLGLKGKSKSTSSTSSKSPKKNHRRTSSNQSIMTMKTISTTTSSKPSSPKNDREHRARLLNRLGIYGKINICPMGDDSTSSNNQGGIGATLSMPANSASFNKMMIQDVPTDPATIRKMNMLRGMGVGGIRLPSEHMPRFAVPSNPSNIVTSRPTMKDIKPVMEPLKWNDDDSGLVNGSSRFKPLQRSRSAGSTSPARRRISPVSSNSQLFAVRAASRSCPEPIMKGSKSNSSSPPRSASNKDQRRGIHFAEDVSVIQIPMRSEYSSRIKSRLYSDRNEIRDNANRNVIEFAAEGWKWQNVVEDDGMFVCTVSGELVHPVHCQDYYRQELPLPPGADDPSSTASQEMPFQ